MKLEARNGCRSRIIALLGFQGAAALDIAGPHEVFALAGRPADGDAAAPYRLRAAAADIPASPGGHTP